MNAPERVAIKPGWYKDLSNEEYHASAGYSSSQLKMLVDHTPAHLHASMTAERTVTENMLLGTVTHTLTLEPEKFDREFAVSEKFDGRTTAGKAAKAAFEAAAMGKTVITHEILDKATAMAKSLLSNPRTAALLDGAIPESSVYWNEDSMLLKVRPDAICRDHPVIVDIKTTRNASYSDFVKSVFNFGYHISAAMYLDGVSQSEAVRSELRHDSYTNFVFLCVENEAPYLTASYELCADDIEFGRVLYRRSLRILQESEQHQQWPGYSEDIRMIEMPEWTRRAHIV